MEPKEKRAFEPTGLVPRSIVRTFERFRQQLLPGSEGAAIREYRISRYQVLVSTRCLFTLLTIPIATNWFVSSWLLSPIIEHFWNTQQNEIFLNAYQEERAFTEMESFSEKLFFESLLVNDNSVTTTIDNNLQSLHYPLTSRTKSVEVLSGTPTLRGKGFAPELIERAKVPVSLQFVNSCVPEPLPLTAYTLPRRVQGRVGALQDKTAPEQSIVTTQLMSTTSCAKLGVVNFVDTNSVSLIGKGSPNCVQGGLTKQELDSSLELDSLSAPGGSKWGFIGSDAAINLAPVWYATREEGNEELPTDSIEIMHRFKEVPSQASVTYGIDKVVKADNCTLSWRPARTTPETQQLAEPSLLMFSFAEQSTEPAATTELLIKQRVQNKILELALYYNQQTISSITNVAGDLISALTLACLFVWMKPEISILKSFLVEAIYSLSDTTKSFLLILLTDLLVGFHSPRGWETALEVLLKHFGLPENQDFVFLFVATFPVLLDTVFKYWIFRHLNKISPSTVATYHSMIE